MVDVMQPTPDMRITDPACGTGGFFLAAYDHILRRNPNLDPDQKRHLRSGLFTGWEIVDNTAWASPRSVEASSMRRCHARDA